MWTRRRRRKERFWIRFAQAGLLLSRLNDSDISSREAARVLSCEAQTLFQACCLAYQAHAAICAKSSAIESRGFELSSHWLDDLNSTTRHLEDHLYSCLIGSDSEAFTAHVYQISLNLTRSPEVLFAYA